jgi:hypothetical protein
MALRHDEASVHDHDVSVSEPVNTPVDEETSRPVTDVMASGRTEVLAPPRDGGPTPGAPLGLILGGFVTLLLSAWAGIVPYLGPTFGYSADGAPSWSWDRVHLLAALVPGAVGVLGSWIVLARARHPLAGRFDASLVGAGLLVVLGGAWLTVAPVVWPAVVGSYFQVASPTMTLAYWLGYASGPGVLLVAFGGFVMGRGIGATSRIPTSPA